MYALCPMKRKCHKYEIFGNNSLKIKKGQQFCALENNLLDKKER